MASGSTASRRHIDYSRSALDQSLYFVNYRIAEQDAQLELVPAAKVGQFLKAGESLGYMKNGSELEPLVATMPGTIVQVLPVPPLNRRTKTAHIFTIQACQHCPRAKIQSQGPVSDLRNTADVCTYCNENISFYYEKQETSVTFGELKRGLGNFDPDDFQWKVVLNEQFTKNTEIGGTSGSEYCINGTGKITFLYDFSDMDNISSNEAVLKYKKVICKHEKITSGFCLFCLTDVKNLSVSNFRRYLFQYSLNNSNPEILVTGSALENQAEQYKRQLVDQKKAVLVLDLDNTILHSISLRRVSEQMRNQLQEYAIIPPEQAPVFIEKTLVKFRPNFGFFLEQVLDCYEIYIYTKGTRLYAEQICRVVRQTYPKLLSNSQNFQPHRIVSRDQDANFTKKDMEFIVPRHRDFMLALDDRRDVWSYSPICVFTRPFVFFYYVAITKDGKTKLEPVEWEKGGGTLERKFNEAQCKKIEEIEQIEQQSKPLQQIAEKMNQLQELIKNEAEQLQQVVVASEQSNPYLTENQHQEGSLQGESVREAKQQAVVVPQTHEGEKQLKHNAEVVDHYLTTTAFALRQAHSIYFSKLALADDEARKQGRFADLTVCFQQYKKGLLDHLCVYFAMRDYKKSAVYRRAQKLGLRIVENPYQKIDLVIRGNNFEQGLGEGSEAANKYYQEMVRRLKSIAQANNVLIVSETWVDICYEYNTCLHYSFFEPSNPYGRAIFSSEAELHQAVGLATSDAADKIREILGKPSENTAVVE